MYLKSSLKAFGLDVTGSL